MPSIWSEQGETARAFDPAARGYSVAYRPGQVNFCPGCGRTHWYVGRVSVECGFCATALPLIEATTRGAAGWAHHSGNGMPLTA